MSTLILEAIGLLFLLIIIKTYFDSFGVGYIPKESITFIDHSLSITTSIFRIEAMIQ